MRSLFLLVAVLLVFAATPSFAQTKPPARPKLAAERDTKSDLGYCDHGIAVLLIRVRGVDDRYGLGTYRLPIRRAP